MKRRFWTCRAMAPLRSKCSTEGWPRALGGEWPPRLWPSGLGVTWAHIRPERWRGRVCCVCSYHSSPCSAGCSSVCSVASVPTCRPLRWKWCSLIWIPLPLPPHSARSAVSATAYATSASVSCLFLFLVEVFLRLPRATSVKHGGCSSPSLEASPIFLQQAMLTRLYG
jgi:hypothetical protein